MKKYYYLILCLLSCNFTAMHKVLIVSLFTNNDPVDIFLTHLTQQTIFDECTTILLSLEATNDQNKNSIYQHQLKRNIILLDSCNENPAKLLNQIFKDTNAAFVCLLSPSCYLYPQTLERSIRCLEKNNGLIGFSDFYIHYNPDVNLTINDYWYLAQYPLNCDINILINAPFVIWKKELHKSCGYFNENNSFVYKEEFCKRIINKNIPYIKIPGVCGVFYFDYRNQKNNFHSSHDFTHYYQEGKSLSQRLNDAPEQPQKPFVIIIPSYNNEHWYPLNLDSALSQIYNNYRVIYINDASTDKTGTLVSDYVTQHDSTKKVTLITNTKRCGALENIYNAVHSCNQKEIIILLDGDDHLIDPYALAYLNSIYQDPQVWMTYGQFIWWPQMIPGSAQLIDEEIIADNSFREYAWTATHLRTFYAGLFHKIQKEDLLFEGTFFPMAWDLALMFPMLEMAGSHSKYISHFMYGYNTINPLSDHASNIYLQQNLAEFIRNKPKYKRLLAI